MLGIAFHSLLQAIVRVVYGIEVSKEVSSLDVEACAVEIAHYAGDGQNWPHPILPGSTDCPAMELIPQYFDTASSQWLCRTNTGENHERSL